MLHTYSNMGVMTTLSHLVTDPLTLKRKTPIGKIANLLDYEVVEKLQRRYCSALDPVESSAGRNAKICSGQKF